MVKVQTFLLSSNKQCINNQESNTFQLTTDGGLLFKAGTQAINEVLKDTKKHLWRESNSSLAIQIAEVTELFGKELASRWSNETTDLSSFQSNIGENTFAYANVVPCKQVDMVQIIRSDNGLTS